MSDFENDIYRPDHYLVENASANVDGTISLNPCEIALNRSKAIDIAFEMAANYPDFETTVFSFREHRTIFTINAVNDMVSKLYD
jgi:hypothetical protein